MSALIPPSPFLSPLAHVQEFNRPRVIPLTSKSASPPHPHLHPHPSSASPPSVPVRTRSSPTQIRTKETINHTSSMQKHAMLGSPIELSKQPHHTYYATHTVRVLPQTGCSRQLRFPHVEALSGELADDEFSQLQASAQIDDDVSPSRNQVRIEEIKTIERIVRVESKLMEPLTQAPSQTEDEDGEGEEDDIPYATEQESLNHQELYDEELDGAQPTDDHNEDPNELYMTQDSAAKHTHVDMNDEEDVHVPWTQVERAIELEESFAEEEENVDEPMEPEHTAEEEGEDQDNDDEECTDEEADDKDQTEFQILSLLSHRINSHGEYEYLCRWTPVDVAEALKKDITYVEDSWEVGELLRGTPILKNYWKAIADEGGYVPAAFLRTQVLSPAQAKPKPASIATPTAKATQPKKQSQSAPASISGKHEAKPETRESSHTKRAKSPVPLKRESSSASSSSSPIITEQGNSTFVYVPAGSLLRVNKLDHSIELLDISAAPVQTVLRAPSPMNQKASCKQQCFPQSIACIDTEFDLSFTPLSASSRSSVSGASTTVPNSGQHTSNPRKRTHDSAQTSPIHSPKLTALKHLQSSKHQPAHMHVTFEEDVECTPKKKQRTTMYSRASLESPSAPKSRATPNNLSPQPPQTHSFVVRTPIFTNVR